MDRIAHSSGATGGTGVPPPPVLGRINFFISSKFDEKMLG